MHATKYGFRKSDPDYWLKTSQAIWNDNGLSTDEKMKAQAELVQEYQSEKRDDMARMDAKAGNFPLKGEMSPEMIAQEIWSIENLKPMFRSEEQKKRLRELKKMQKNNK